METEATITVEIGQACEAQTPDRPCDHFEVTRGDKTPGERLIELFVEHLGEATSITGSGISMLQVPPSDDDYQFYTSTVPLRENDRLYGVCTEIATGFVVPVIGVLRPISDKLKATVATLLFRSRESLEQIYPDDDIQCDYRILGMACFRWFNNTRDIPPRPEMLMHIQFQTGSPMSKAKFLEELKFSHAFWGNRAMMINGKMADDKEKPDE